MTELMRQARALWPRRAPDLPPGQRVLDAFPRFSDNPLRPPPAIPDQPVLRVVSPEGDDVRVTHDELRASELARSQTSDLHCVTTWTARGQRWTGVPLAAWWQSRVAPTLPDMPDFAVVRGYDGYQAAFLTEDLFADDVMLAWDLDQARLDARHGHPLRLVSPSQYGYKNVKHVEAIVLCTEQPVSRLGPKEHLRARVAFEERHSRLPARLLRWPYRLLVPVTAMLAETALQRHEEHDEASTRGTR